MAAKERLNELDTLKWLTMLLVVWGHYIIMLHPGDPSQDWLRNIIYSFHMPLFMGLSGFFAANIGQLRLTNVLRKKGMQILLPAFSACTLAFILRYIETGSVGGRIAETWLFHYWFLKSLFACCVIFWFATRFNKRFMPWLLVLTVIGSQWLGDTPVFLQEPLSLFWPEMHLPQMYPSFVLGALLRWNFEWCKERWKGIAVILSFVYFVIMLSPSLVYDKLSLLAGLCAAGAIITIFSVLGKRIKRNAVYDYMCDAGQLTLGIYILDGFIACNYIPRILNVPEMPIWVFHFCICLGLALLEMIVCAVIIKQGKRIPIFAFIFLGIDYKIARGQSRLKVLEQ